ncbi:MAG: TRAP transporter small permease [Gammaproteobacteria bacterium]|nr:TRAP transporter small permease [Gammaproteobacteria bacterium]NNL50714.1 TRAP transporter small permease [Woeseiaceae bacterium]
MNGLLRVVDRLLSGALVVLVAAMVVSVTWQILSRYLFVVPAAWTEELARFLLIWIGMLGAAYAYKRHSHLGLDLLPGKLTGTSKASLNIVTHLVCMSFAAVVLVVGGGSLVTMTWELRQYSAAMGLPIAFVYAVIPASGVLICLFALVGMVHEPQGGED